MNNLNINNIGVALLALVTVITTMCICNSKIEGFTAPGLVFNIPSPWWHPQTYESSDWTVPMYLDQLSQPSCLSYNRGDPGPLNFNASAYRFWRF